MTLASIFWPQVRACRPTQVDAAPTIKFAATDDGVCHQ
ncbi:hypothetical protein PPTG_23288 [Phytophthora nicotianae INRA-310]|uniref:Uncharacterized protein n=1 Tax=Phytophthora nicotianae (strain INRA-310) TaxID=761204 RepID=W2Q3R7_PHYN3|nr:hypothetical protein PPTG_23288 [Phytophthora nicotianae INRA-310]ETN06905.1 hypothetical protein PPTG_23288 [Phytophthora nicotianae INRA-310]